QRGSAAKQGGGERPEGDHDGHRDNSLSVEASRGRYSVRRAQRPRFLADSIVQRHNGGGIENPGTPPENADSWLRFRSRERVDLTGEPAISSQHPQQGVNADVMGSRRRCCSERPGPLAPMAAGDRIRASEQAPEPTKANGAAAMTVQEPAERPNQALH